MHYHFPEYPKRARYFVCFEKLGMGCPGLRLAAAFERDPLFRDKLRLRALDEQATIPGKTVTGLESYRALLERDLRS
jgi:predicted HD phosphohydrolase